MTEIEKTTTRDLEQLIGRGRAGDEEARNELFERYGPRVADIVHVRMRSFLRGHAQSGDLVQMTLLEALRRLDSFELRGRTSFVRWLARLVESEVCNTYDYLTRSKRDVRRNVGLDSSPDDGAEAGPAATSPSGPTPSRVLIADERAEIVRECIASLPERYREIILMRDYEDTDWQEARETMGVSTENAARMLHLRAVTKLGECLRQRGVELE